MQRSAPFLPLAPVAIVGVSAELPSGLHSNENLNHKTFHKFLMEQKESYETIPGTRFNSSSWKGTGLGRVATDTGCFLKDIDLFDYVEFGVSSKDAHSMGVSTRKLLELSFLALLDSGIDYRTKNVGCYMAAVDFDMLNIADPDEYEARGSFAGIPCMVANRISYHLDLLGPSIPLDTACSSSLTAMHLAVQALRNGDCSAAIVGGCQLNHRLVDWVMYSQGSVLAPDGKSKPFDASANGFARGEGAVVVVVKLLNDALRDGDHIYASILGTGINSCGSAAPISAPNAEAQVDAMVRAYSNTGRSPKEVDYVELHATGTAAGDPIEANWVGEHMGRGDPDDLLIGSVKGNIGHLEIAAFLASLVKICSIFSTGMIQPNANLTHRNPNIHWEKYKLRVPTVPTPLLVREKSAKAVVSIASSGIGGSNGHAVVQSPEITGCSSTAGMNFDRPVLLLAAGLSPRSATAVGDDLQHYLDRGDRSDLHALALVMGRRARQMTWRSATVLCPGQNYKLAFPTPTIAPRQRPTVAFVFSGQGPQHIAMGRQLYELYPAFRNSVNSSDAIYKSITGESFITTYGLFGGEAIKTLPLVWPIYITLPAIAIVQIALVDLLGSVNITPDIVLGHSAGETAMLYMSCRASREMVVQLAVARGLALSDVESIGGGMAALSCPAKEAQRIVDDVVGDCEETATLEVGCLNGPSAVTLSGDGEYLERAVCLAQSREIFATKLRTSTPIHCRLVESCHSIFSTLVGDVFKRHQGDYVPRTTTYSTLTGDRWAEPFTSEYFWETTRHAVKFTQAMEAVMRDAPDTVFIELSPHPVLASYIASHGVTPECITCPMRRFKSLSQYDEAKTFLDAIGKLVVRGLNSVDFAALHGVDVRCMDLAAVDAPKYPFNRKHVPYYPEASSIVQRQLSPGKRGPLSGPNLKVNSMTHPLLAQHVIKDEPIMPAAGFLEMIFELGATEVWNVRFHSMLSLSSSNPTPVHVELDGLSWTVKSTTIFGQLQVNASGNMSRKALLDEEFQRLDLPSIQARCKRMKIEGFYESLKSLGSYGPVFQRIQAVYKGEDEFLVQVRGTADDLTDMEGYILHPAVLDSSIHIAVHKTVTGSADDNIYYLPSRVERVIVHDLLREGVPETLFVHVQFCSWRPDALTLNFYITNSAGDHLMTLRGFEVAKHGSDFQSGIKHCFELVHKPLDGLVSPHLLHPENKSLTSLPSSLQFVRGNEMSIQRSLLLLDQESSEQIWITATSGADGAAARGFSRSLRREISNWDIRLVIFMEGWTPVMRNCAVSYLVQSGVAEQEISVNESGAMTTPRFEESELHHQYLLPHNQRWKVNSNGGMSYTGLPFVSEGFVLVAIYRVSVAEGGLRGFLGEIAFGTRKGERVVGITDDLLSNFALVRVGWSVPIEPSVGREELLPTLALGAVLAGQTLGISILDHPSRANNLRISIVGFQPDISRALGHIFSLLGIHCQVEEASVVQLLTSLTSGIVSSGCTDKEDIQLLKSLLPIESSLIMCNDKETGTRAMICKQPWFAADAMAGVFRLSPSYEKEALKIPDSILVSDLYMSSKDGCREIYQSLFDASKAYLLVGGVGSLGIHVALWMYQRGARIIVLTSRNGLNSPAYQKNATCKRIFGYLQTLHDLSIRIVACDARSIFATETLLKSIVEPLGGCMLLSVVVADKTFFAQTEETFAMPFESKSDAFSVLEQTLNIGDLDFLITFSTVSTFGNAGQTNYAAANTELEELTRQYDNAFALVCPLVLDSSINMGESASTKLAHMAKWGVTAEDVCGYIEDGILKLKSGPFALYVPDMNWNEVYEGMGPSYLYDHLVRLTTTADARDEYNGESASQAMARTVKDRLGVNDEDFSPNVPLTSYGLDSLSAAQLSIALKPFLPITQLQLLANISLTDIISRLETHADGDSSLERSNNEGRKHFDWSALNKLGETVVKLCDYPGTPLILLHGASGTVVAFKSLQDSFKSALWALQTTSETPLHSVEAMALFYYEQIKVKQPRGPYRLGVFSGTSVIAYQLVMTFEERGDIVEQFVLLDHFPLLFFAPICRWDSTSLESRIPSRALLRNLLVNMRDLYYLDINSGRRKIADEYLCVFDENEGINEVPELTKYAIRIFESIASASLKFVLTLSSESDILSLQLSLSRWLRKVKIRPSLYIASQGISETVPLEIRAGWRDFGIGPFSLDVEVINIDGSHFSIMENPRLIKSLERQ